MCYFSKALNKRRTRETFQVFCYLFTTKLPGRVESRQDAKLARNCSERNVRYHDGTVIKPSLLKITVSCLHYLYIISEVNYIIMIIIIAVTANSGQAFYYRIFWDMTPSILAEYYQPSS
jgi:hypothetical protein